MKDMKNGFIIFLSLLLPSFAFSQSGNVGFEMGNTSGWICKSGTYGSKPICLPAVACSRFEPVLTATTPINSGGINAALVSNYNRHTIVTGPGKDPNSNLTVPVVSPNGGNYSFRLGNDLAPGVPGTPDAQAEAIRLNFSVTAENAGFTYSYAFFVQNPGHPFSRQPGFEAVVMDEQDSILPCGRYRVAIESTPACVNKTGFMNGANGYVYKNWTDVGVDLSAYIGQKISIEFRTTDCVPEAQTSCSSCSGNICTICYGANCCTFASPQTWCIPAPGCPPGMAGSHSAYAYIDASYGPAGITAPEVCPGASSLQICAPAGYESYSWPAGQPGIAGAPSTQCVTVSSPVPGTKYTVNLVSRTGCSSQATVTLKPASITVNSAIICAGDSAVLTAPPASSYSWNTGESTASITVSPGATTHYTVVTNSETCRATGTATVTVVSSLSPVITGPDSICAGSSASLHVTGGNNHYLWNTGATTASIVIAPTSSSAYSVVATSAGCSDTAIATLHVNPAPQVSLLLNKTAACVDGVPITLSGGLPTGGFYSGPAVSEGKFYPYSAGAGSHVITYTFTDANGCTASASFPIVVNPLPFVTLALEPDTVCINAGVITASGGTPAGGTYSGAGFSGATFYPIYAGIGTHNVTYTYTDANGCINRAYDVIVVDPCSGIQQLDPDLSVSITPNPGSGIFKIQIGDRPNAGDAYSIEVLNLIGETVYSSKEKTSQVKIDLSKEKNGVYFLQVKSAGAVTSRKLIIQK